MFAKFNDSEWRVFATSRPLFSQGVSDAKTDPVRGRAKVRSGMSWRRLGRRFFFFKNVSFNKNEMKWNIFIIFFGWILTPPYYSDIFWYLNLDWFAFCWKAFFGWSHGIHHQVNLSIFSGIFLVTQIFPWKFHHSVIGKFVHPGKFDQFRILHLKCWVIFVGSNWELWGKNVS